MRKIVVILSVLVLLFAFVSCKESVDRLFGFDLTLEANDGTGTKTTVRINGADGKVPECPFSWDGHVFAGWNTKQDGSGTSYEEGDAVPQDKDHTLYAQWSFDLTLEANDGTGTKTTVRINVTGGKIPECPFSWDGHGLAGWNTKQDGSGTSYKRGDAVPEDKDHTLYAQWGIALTETMKDWTDGNTYALDRDITISERVSVDGDVVLYLSEEYTLTASCGIDVRGGRSISIDGSGTLDASSYYSTGSYPAIGRSTEEASTIVIKGGTINAKTVSDHSCAAISAGTISIYGGIVTASILNPDIAYGAGIGGGMLCGGGTITICGGIVTANGGGPGAGIGGCEADGGNITIYGGTVTASGYNSGAGIGGGGNGNGGNIAIYGGTVTATGGAYGAGIGGGSHSAGGTISIYGGTVIASGGTDSAGIGGGCEGADGTLNHPGVSLKVSDDNSTWTDYNGTRKRYMKTIR